MTYSENLAASVADRITADEVETRLSAVRDLLELEASRAVPLLLKALADKSPRIRSAVLDIVCLFPEKVLFPSLKTFVENEEDANVRNAAIDAFERYGRVATPFVAEMLSEPNERMRMYAALILGRIGDPASVDHLLPLVEDPSMNVRHNVIEALGNAGDARAVTPLVACLAEDLWIQYPAIVALGHIGDARALEPLKKLLGKDLVTTAVITSIGLIGELGSIPELVRFADTHDEDVMSTIVIALADTLKRSNDTKETRNACVRLLQKEIDTPSFHQGLIDALKSSEKKIARSAAALLGAIEDELALPHLVELIQDYELEVEAGEAIVAIGRRNARAVIEQLEHPDDSVRAALIQYLGLTGDGPATIACLPYFKDQNAEVRLQAAVAVSRHTHLHQVESALIDAVTDESVDIRTVAFGALRRSSPSVLVNHLISRLTGSNEKDRLEALELLGKLNADTAVPVVCSLLGDPSEEIRAAAHRAMHAIRPGEETLEGLVTGLEDESTEVRKAVTVCLASYNEEVAISTLAKLLEDIDPSIQLTAIEGLGNLGAVSHVDNLFRQYEKGDTQTKIAVTRALGGIDCDSVTQFLSKVLEEQISDLRRVALESLARQRDPEVLPIFISALDDPQWSVRVAAVEAIGILEDTSGVSPLVGKLDDKEEIVVSAAINALGNIGDDTAVSHLLVLLHHETLQAEIISALEKLGIPDVVAFEDCLQKANTRLKCLLMDMLGRMDDEAAVKCLSQSLEQDFYSVRLHAARALGALSTRNSVPTLIRMQMEDESDEVKREATKILKTIKQ